MEKIEFLSFFPFDAFLLLDYWFSLLLKRNHFSVNSDFKKKLMGKGCIEKINLKFGDGDGTNSL